MRVFLVYPGWPDHYWPRGAFRSHWVPLGLAHIASFLEKEGCEVRVLSSEEHMIKKNYNRAAVDEFIRGQLREFMPDLVGLSILTPGMIEAARIAGFAKSICGADTIVVAGGPHPTALPERTLREIPELDAVVTGEGELTVSDLISRGIGDDVPGLVFRSGDKFIATPPRPREKDLDLLGAPAYHLFDMKFHTEPNRWMVPWLNFKATNLSTSRGCLGSCLFCAGPLVSGHEVRYHSIDYVVDRIEHVVGAFGVEAIHFEDDSIGADPDRLVLLCEALRGSGLNKIPWDCSLRVDQASPELLSEIKSAGCIMVEYGIETGSEELLEAIGKKTSLELNRRAVQTTREAGLRIFADIMFGLPGETEKDWDDTVSFLRWAKPEIIRAGLLCPLPGTAFFDRLPSDVRDSIRWEDYTYLNTLGLGLVMSGLPEKEVRSRYRKLDKYFLHPHLVRAMLRDSGPDEHELRRFLRKKIIGFALRHPIRAARLPCRWGE